jgi:transposase
MDAIVVGIDVSKDKLDIAVLPQGQTFAISRDAKGLEGLAMHSPGH